VTTPRETGKPRKYRGFRVERIEDGWWASNPQHVFGPFDTAKAALGVVDDTLGPLPTRHKWVKLRIHVYICTVCGCGRVNDNDEGDWRTTFHLPTGESKVLRHVPPCDVGPLTPKYLARYESDIQKARQTDGTNATAEAGQE
jgi:hypothetical protein